MTGKLLHALLPFLDLVALSALAGASLCHFWASSGTPSTGAALCATRCRKLLLLAALGLTISSSGDLLQRTAEMSAVGFPESLPLVSTVIAETHYGTMWLVKIAALCLLWLVLSLTGRQEARRSIACVMMGVVAVVAFSRSAVSHAADFGDLSIPQIADWLHLLAAVLWSGTLLVLSTAFSIRKSADDSTFVAGIAGPFYACFGPVFAMLVFTGLYNAWVEVGSFSALLSTVYGRLLLLKLVVLALLTARYVAPPIAGNDIPVFAHSFLRKVRIDALLVLIILFAVALFTHEIPARHAHHHPSAHPQHHMP